MGLYSTWNRSQTFNFQFHQILREGVPCRSSCPQDRQGPCTFGRGATEPWRYQDKVPPFKFSLDKIRAQRVQNGSDVLKENLSIPDGGAEVASVFICSLLQRPRDRRCQGAFLLLLPSMCRPKTDWNRGIHTLSFKLNFYKIIWN